MQSGPRFLPLARMTRQPFLGESKTSSPSTITPCSFDLSHLAAEREALAEELLREMEDSRGCDRVQALQKRCAQASPGPMGVYRSCRMSRPSRPSLLDPRRVLWHRPAKGRSRSWNVWCQNVLTLLGP